MCEHGVIYHVCAQTVSLQHPQAPPAILYAYECERACPTVHQICADLHMYGVLSF